VVSKALKGEGKPGREKRVPWNSKKKRVGQAKRGFLSKNWFEKIMEG